MIQIHISVPAVPVAQPRQRHRNVVTGSKQFIQNYTPSKHPATAFKATVRMAFEAAYSGRPPLAGPIRCDLVFVMPRPKALIWKTRPMPRAPHDKKPDRDNLDKCVLDALKGLAWNDDSQVCQGEIQKWIASGDEQPHVEISISTVE